MKNKPDFIFTCRKCSHEVYVDKKKVQKMCDQEECDECGEETPIFILTGEGDFENRYI